MNSKSIEDDVIQILSRTMSDPSLSDIDLKNKMAWAYTTLKTYALKPGSPTRIFSNKAQPNLKKITTRDPRTTTGPKLI